MLGGLLFFLTKQTTLNSDKLREIAEYLCEVYDCPECGVSSNPKSIHIDETINKVFHRKYVALCPDCGYKFGTMKKSKIPKFFFGKKVGMIYPADLEKWRLQWMIKINHFALKNQSVREAVMEAILDHEAQELADIKDIENEKNEMKVEINKLELEIDVAEESIQNMRKKILTLSSYYASNEMSKAIQLKQGQIINKKSKIIKLKDKLNGTNRNNNTPDIIIGGKSLDLFGG